MLRCLGFVLAGVAAAQPFPHELHLKLQLECTTCHSAATASTSASDNLLPDAKLCAKCHEKMTVRTPSVSHVVVFSHQFHLKFGNIAPLVAAAIKSKSYLGKPALAHLDARNACEACHGASGSLPNMADCLVCHNKVDPPFSCEQCHARSMTLKPANHTADFLDRHTTGKLALDKSTCAVCHGKRFTCLGCH